MPFVTTKAVGPLVLEFPPADEGSNTGTIMNCLQEALERGSDGYSYGSRGMPEDLPTSQMSDPKGSEFAGCRGRFPQLADSCSVVWPTADG